MDWIKSNYGTVLIIAVLLLVVALIIRGLIKDRKKGKHICGGNCGSCGNICETGRRDFADEKGKAPDSLYEIKVKIDGMYCGMCEAHVNDAVRSSLDIKKIHSDAKKGEAVIVSKLPYSEAKIREILDPTGYKVLSVEYKRMQ